MKVICVSAKARHGKDTVAAILKEQLQAKGNKVLITHFADLLKYICKTFFNWNGDKDEAGRTLLQYVGTDVIGAKYPGYWANFIANFLNMFKDEWDYVLIPDCRYPIEIATMINNFNTYLLRVERPNFDNGLTEKQKNHPSEIALDNYDFDKIILNNGTLVDLENKVKEFIEEIY